MESPSTSTAPADLSVTHATREDWRTVEQWIAAQNWDPGISDADLFYETDPDGYFVGRIGDEIVSSIAVVNYDSQYAYLGQYMVRPDLRGNGYGVATWRAAIGHAGERAIELEAGDEHLAKYRRAGFSDVYRSRHYTGRIDPRPWPQGVVEARAWDPVEIGLYDAQAFPADRSRFVVPWLTARGHLSYVRVIDGVLRGYGVIREAVSGFRVGPLVADTPRDALALMTALTAEVGGEEVSLEAPLAGQHAAAFAETVGLEPTYETTRMHTRPTRPVDHDLSFAIASFELG